MGIRYTAAFLPSGPVTQEVIFTVANTEEISLSFTVGAVTVVDFGISSTREEEHSFIITTTLFLPENGFFLF